MSRKRRVANVNNYMGGNTVTDTKSVETDAPVWTKASTRRGGRGGVRTPKNTEIRFSVIKDTRLTDDKEGRKRVSIIFYDNANIVARTNGLICISQINKKSKRLYMLFSDEKSRDHRYQYYTISKLKDNTNSCSVYISIPFNDEAIEAHEAFAGYYEKLKYDTQYDAFYIDKEDRF